MIHFRTSVSITHLFSHLALPPSSRYLITSTSQVRCTRVKYKDQRIVTGSTKEGSFPARTRTDTETPFLIVGAKYPRYIFRKSDGPCAKTTGMECAQYRSLVKRKESSALSNERAEDASCHPPLSL